MAELKIGDYVKGKRFGSFEHDFQGEIEKVYENSVLIHILEFDQADRILVGELNNRAIVRKDDATLAKVKNS
ncbi:hypothetical protein AYR62_07285 [Secundilactobacillus paracollinoides]|uniref:DUF2187 domain-containing protein n=1 Tax=Secundilactobacillus paracollinoides TaxID=240427 RepID=A0A1B2J1J5_9LACO|nr:hypothetical protein [Secundilactobacillus paracollinoides]ANZ63912.1 hypothetical protein AYR62_07285 [Secundilactobacillus paracollinoides]ANZ68171.1 hypothetical protein AYR63_14175 [Secundilactobacillus paracollinoides]KRL76344.1 hypothetical protein FC17_GL001847 [Secundilactobacillus paracollinoides DSM 15502 = JCM 11969]